MSAAASTPLVSSPSAPSAPNLHLDNICYCDAGRGIRLAYESFGSPDAPPLLLVMASMRR